MPIIRTCQYVPYTLNFRLSADNSTTVDSVLSPASARQKTKCLISFHTLFFLGPSLLFPLNSLDCFSSISTTYLNPNLSQARVKILTNACQADETYEFKKDSKSL